MAEKKRGFHALERRIHEIEDEDRAAAARGEPQEKEAAKRETTRNEKDAKRE